MQQFSFNIPEQEERRDFTSDSSQLSQQPPSVMQDLVHLFTSSTVPLLSECPFYLCETQVRDGFCLIGQRGKCYPKLEDIVITIYSNSQSLCLLQCTLIMQPMHKEVKNNPWLLIFSIKKKITPLFLRKRIKGTCKIYAFYFNKHKYIY